MPSNPCPSQDELRGLVLGEIASDAEATVAGHVDRCARCDATVRRMERELDAVARVIGAAQAPPDYAAERACLSAIERVRAFEADSAMVIESRDGDCTSLLPDQDRIRDYILLDRLGEGGMGTVYKAVHTQLQRPVALKVIRSDKISHRAVNRFRREMHAVGRLDHPNIVRATDAGHADGIDYLVMELVDGINLSQLVQNRGPLPVAQACELIRQAAVGLQHAHARGLIHRDVKPSNLMLTAAPDNAVPSTACHGGIVKILDMGLARLEQPSWQSADETPSPDDETVAINQQQENTRTSRPIGTIDYTAPEQLHNGTIVDERADVYSLGATLYKLLAGCAPRDIAAHVPERAIAHGDSGVVPIGQRRAGVPVELQSILDRMLADRPRDRFADMSQVVDALEPLCATADLAELLVADEADRNSSDAVAAGRADLVDSRGIRHAFSARRRWRPRVLALIVGLSTLSVFAAVVITARRPDLFSAAPATPEVLSTGRPSSNSVSSSSFDTHADANSSTSRTPDDGFALRFTGRHSVELSATGDLSNADDDFTAEIWLRPFICRESSVWMGNTFFPEDEPSRLDFSDRSVGWLLGTELNSGNGKQDVLVYFAGRDAVMTLRRWSVPPLHDKWLHFAVCQSPKQMSLFVHGRKAWTHRFVPPKIAPPESPSNVHLGCPQHDSWSKQFLGDVCAFRLSQGQRYDADFSPPTRFDKDEDTLVLLDFSAPQGGSIRDLSGNDRHGTIVGAEWVPVATPIPDQFREATPTTGPAGRFGVHGVAYYTEAIRLDPYNAELYVQRSAAYADDGELELAIADCDAALRIDPNLASAYVNRAIALSRNREFERAIADCTAALRIHPNYADAYYNRGTARGEYGEFEQAVADCTEAIRLDPTLARAYGSRGVARGRMGDFGRAIVDFTEALRLDPNDAKAYYNRSYCYHKLGEEAKAASDLTKARELGFDGK